MTGAALSGTTLRGRFEPRNVVARLDRRLRADRLRDRAPLRARPASSCCASDLGGGRREAVFITRAELRGRLARLPATLRAIFDPFEL